MKQNKDIKTIKFSIMSNDIIGSGEIDSNGTLRVIPHGKNYAFVLSINIHCTDVGELIKAFKSNGIKINNDGSFDNIYRVNKAIDLSETDITVYTIFDIYDALIGMNEDLTLDDIHIILMGLYYDMLVYFILGDDYYIVDPITTIQANRIITVDILNKFISVKKSVNTVAYTCIAIMFIFWLLNVLGIVYQFSILI